MCLISRSDEVKVKDQGQGRQGQKRHFSTLSAAGVRFMFGKRSLASIVYNLNYSDFAHLHVVGLPVKLWADGVLAGAGRKVATDGD